MVNWPPFTMMENDYAKEQVERWTSEHNALVEMSKELRRKNLIKSIRPNSHISKYRSEQ